MTDKVEIKRIRDLSIWCNECDKPMKFLGIKEISSTIANSTQSIFICRKCKHLISVDNGDYNGDPENMLLELTHPIDPKEAEEYYLKMMEKKE